MIAFELAFWTALAVLFFTYMGYPIVLFVLARRRPSPVIPDEPFEPRVSMVVAARNESAHIQAKVRNAFELDYPAHRLEVIVVDDASEDDTLVLLESMARSGLRTIAMGTHHGKAACLNRGAQEATGEILVFSDADSLISAHSLRRLVQPLANPIVGCVAGRYFPDGVRGRNAGGVGAYWRYENYLRRKESQMGGLLGASGSLYALRRGLYEPLDARLINDDFVIPMSVALKGYRTLYEPSATALEDESRNEELEFARRVRIMTGNCQHLWLFRRLLANPLGSRMGFQLFCHKLLRVVSPLWLILLLGASMVLFVAGEGARVSLYGTLLFLQGTFYALALAGWRPRGEGARRFRHLVGLPYYFVMVNVAALLGMRAFLFESHPVAWGQRQTRDAPSVSGRAGRRP